MPVADRILIVDDEPDVLLALHDILADLPRCSIEPADTFAAGRELALQGGWSMAIVDERLPGGKGVAILAELRRTHPETVRVMMSAHHDFPDLVEGVNLADIDHFIQKPWDPFAVQFWVAKRLAERKPEGSSGERLPLARPRVTA